MADQSIRRLIRSRGRKRDAWFLYLDSENPVRYDINSNFIVAYAVKDRLKLENSKLNFKGFQNS
jgi:hypothetical protein